MTPHNHILIIDDDLAMCQLLQRMLEKHYHVTTKNDGMSAMYWLAQGNLPDLIITDLDMPNINGEDFVINLKNSGFFSEVPFIVITGFAGKEQKIKCMKLGIHDYFEKPFNPSDLLLSVEVILKHNQKKLKIQ